MPPKFKPNSHCSREYYSDKGGKNSTGMSPGHQLKFFFRRYLTPNVAIIKVELGHFVLLFLHCSTFTSTKSPAAAKQSPPPNSVTIPTLEFAVYLTEVSGENF